MSDDDETIDAAIYGTDVDDPILIEINRKLGSVVTVEGVSDVLLSRPWFSAEPEE
jgi:hypothetical protein